ncbi:unnamed protein product [Notodromas monacha]|uniref:Uncharacterized protein n=1 Tax=Notodromas monacha TaxID=399045 RepID=A0A7R9BKG0_9CRUS|nr:unnamed protein product [Notodromas monacha]CAG0916354.1 unnamed protein product [Notodromas monacha]
MSILLGVFVLAATAFCVQAQGFRPSNGPQFSNQGGDKFPDFPSMCRMLNDPAIVDQYVDCALDLPGACNGIQGLSDIRQYLQVALPAALGKGRCSFCSPNDTLKINFLARELRTRFKPETGKLLRHFSKQIAANGGLRAQTAADTAGAPPNCAAVLG